MRRLGQDGKQLVRKPRVRGRLTIVNCLCQNCGYKTKTARREQSPSKNSAWTLLLYTDSLEKLAHTWPNAKPRWRQAFLQPSSFGTLLNWILPGLSLSDNKEDLEKNASFVDAVYDVEMESEILKAMATRNATESTKLFDDFLPLHSARAPYLFFATTLIKVLPKPDLKFAYWIILESDLNHEKFSAERYPNLMHIRLERSLLTIHGQSLYSRPHGQYDPS